MIALAKAQPEKYQLRHRKHRRHRASGRAAVAGKGRHLAIHSPYSGAGQAATDLVAGHLDVNFSALQAVLGLIRGGQIRALATSGGERQAMAPEIPTFREFGLPDVVVAAHWCLYAPAGTPPAIVQGFGAAWLRAIAEPAVRAEVEKRGYALVNADAARTAEIVRDEYEKWVPSCAAPAPCRGAEMSGTREGAVRRATESFDGGATSPRCAGWSRCRPKARCPSACPTCTATAPRCCPASWKAWASTSACWRTPTPAAARSCWPRRIEDPSLPTVLVYGHGDVVRGLAGTWSDGRDPWAVTQAGTVVRPRHRGQQGPAPDRHRGAARRHRRARPPRLQRRRLRRDRRGGRLPRPARS